MVTIRRVNYRDDPNILLDDPHGGFDVPLGYVELNCLSLFILKCMIFVSSMRIIFYHEKFVKITVYHYSYRYTVKNRFSWWFFTYFYPHSCLAWGKKKSTKISAAAVKTDGNVIIFQ